VRRKGCWIFFSHQFHHVDGHLNAPYTKDEMKTTFFHMFPTKAPGLDGFSTHFFIKNRTYVVKMLTGMVLCVLSGDDSPEEIN